MALDVVRADIPEAVLEAIRLGRMTALQKPGGGVRGIVVGDILRRLVAKTLAQGISHHIEAATSPFQYALTTRCGCECIAHAAQALTDADLEATVLSIDGIGAFDLISRAAMLTVLKDAPGCDRALPFVHQFYGRPSSYIWEDDSGTTHEIRQGEGGEQGDPFMPALFALGQHPALVAAQSAMHPSTKLMAFLDDVHVVTTPPRVAHSYAPLDRALWEHAGIRINQGKTQIFNRAGVFPRGCQHILRAGRQVTPPVVVWRGDSALPSDQWVVTILGTPLGHADFVRAQLRAKIEEHRLLLDRVEAVPDLQCAWLILSFCGATRANYYLRTIHPSGSEEFAATHDAAIMRVFFRPLDIRGDQDTLNLASLPCRLGGVGLQNAVRGAPAAYWSSWADSLHMIRKRHPDVADFITVALSRGEGGPHMEAAARCRGNLVDLGFEAPEWEDLARGARPDFDPMANRIPASKHGWQQKASNVVENSFLAQLIWPTLAPPEQALLRSQQGSPVHLLAYLAGNDVPAARAQGVVPPTSLATFAPVFVHLSVWPSTRLSWPPPCSVSVGRGVGPPRIFAGERSSSRLPGGREKGHDQRPSPGHGPPTSPSSRQP